MRISNYVKAGTWFFALSIIALGIIHEVTQNFPTALLPVPASLPIRIAFVNITGVILTVAGILMLTKKYKLQGAYFAGTIFILMLLLVHIPKLLSDVHNPGGWTPMFEVVGLLAGTFLLAGNFDHVKNSRFKLLTTGRYLFASALLVFAVQHYLYTQFIGTLIPSWIPVHIFWATLVTVAFIAAAVSLIIKVQVRLTDLLLAAMFLIWFLILHIPRVEMNSKTETEWTSLFVVLAMAGVSLLLAAKSKNSPIDIKI